MKRFRSFPELEVFKTTARLGSFTAAADSLALTKSSIGKTISKLEDRFGGLLFIRKRGNQNLTPLGYRLLEASEKLLSEADQLEDFVYRGHQDVEGTLSINVPIAFGKRWLMRPIAEFARHYPGIQLNVNFSDEFISIVEEPFDLCVRLGGDIREEAAVAVDIGFQEYGLYASPNYIAANGRIRSPEDLSKHSFIAFNRRFSHSRLEFKIDGVEYCEVVRPKHVIGEGESMLEATIQDLGVAKLPDWLCKKAYGAGQLERLCDNWVFDRSPIQIILSRKRSPSLPVDLFIEQLTQNLKLPS